MNNATKQDIERACEIVYEAITGKCWHVLECEGKKNNYVLVWVKRKKDYDYICSKCKKLLSDFPNNPPLSTSLDAWAEHIWPVMTDEQWEIYIDIICQLSGSSYDSINDGTISIEEYTQMFLLSPIKHHLEAALRALNLYDEWEATNGD